MMNTVTGDDIVTRIVHPIAEAEGADPLDLPPVGWFVDVDALVSSFQSGAGVVSDEFKYMGRSITVEGNGTVSMSYKNDTDGTFVCQCITCDEAIRRVDHDAAQEFFAAHLDRGHAPELFRTDRPGTDQPTDIDADVSNEGARTD